MASPSCSKTTEAEITVCKECRDFRAVPKQMYGRNIDPDCERVGFYDSHYEKPDWWKTGLNLFDESKGMYNDLIGIFKRVSLPKDDPAYLNFYYLTVKHDAFERFLEKMAKISDEIALLPYWCLCDGMTPDREIHRHMILACYPRSSFEHVWKKELRFPLKTSGKRCQHNFRIKNAFHLSNCIQNVSQRESSCGSKNFIAE